MKNFKQHKILGSNGSVILLVLFFLIQILQIQAQHISNNGAYISVTTGTFIEMDSITNYNNATLVNNGTLTLTQFNNSANVENNETLATTTINNSGTFQNTEMVTATDVNNTVTFDNSGTLTAINTVTNSGTFTNGGDFNAVDLENTGTSTFDNTGTLNASTINNVGNTLGDGTYNILGNFTSTGTFFSEAGIVNMIGTTPQTMEMAVTTINNLVIDNAAAVTLNSTQTIITNELTINFGKILKIQADKNMTVTGVINNDAGTTGLILKSDATGTASLLHNNLNVPVTVERYITGIAEDWHFLSAPVSDQSISGDWNPSGTYGNGTGYDLYIFNEPTPCWTYQLNMTLAPTWPSIHPTSNFVTGRGYLYSTQASNPTKEFVGLLNNGTINYPVTSESPDLVIQGFNLVGNPYPSSVDWKSSSGWSRTPLVSSGGGYDMWIWNPASNNYGVFNSAGNAGTNGVTQYIAPSQGYFVRAVTNGNISMSNLVRVNEGASNWLKGEREPSKNLKIRKTSSKGNGYDEVLLQFGFLQNEAGARKLFSENALAPSAYLNDSKNNLSVRYLTDTIQNSKIPLSFQAGEDESFSLSVGNETTAFKILLLEDKKTKTVTDLKLTSTYLFEGNLNDDLDRFIIHFKETPIVTEGLPIAIFYDGEHINVDLSLVEEATTIQVFDMLGRLVLETEREGKIVHQLKTTTASAIYIVLATNKGKTAKRNIIIY
jgi:hypothetical protein